MDTVPSGISIFWLVGVERIAEILACDCAGGGSFLSTFLLNPVGYLPTRTYFYPDRFYGRNRIIDTLEATYGRYRVEMDMTNYALMRRNLGDIYTIQTMNGYGATVNKDFSDLISRYPAQEREVIDLLNVRYVITDKQIGQRKYLSGFYRISKAIRANDLVSALLLEASVGRERASDRTRK